GNRRAPHDRQGMFERELQDFVHGFDEVDGHLRLNFRRNIRKVLFVVLGQNHGTNAEPVGGQQLFLHAANGKHLAAQGDFTRHGYVAANGDARERADDRGADRDPGGWAVLGYRAFGDVHVNINVAIKILGQAEKMAARPDVTHSGLRRFLHHVAELPGEGEPALALHQRGFGGEHLPAHFGPRESNGQPHFVLFFRPKVAVFDDAEIFADVRRRDFRGDALAIGNHLARDLAAHVGDLTVEVAYAGLVRVMADDVRHAFIGEFQVFLRQAGAFDLLVDQITLGDLMLFLLGISGDAQHFHAVLERLWNRVQHV